MIALFADSYELLSLHELTHAAIPLATIPNALWYHHI